MTGITLATLPERVTLTERAEVSHQGRVVGSLHPPGVENPAIVAYHNETDELGGDGTVAGALSWLRATVSKRIGTPILDPISITEPGFYDLSPDVYHGDPVPSYSLSVSRAKRLLGDGGPAKFHYRELAGPETKPEYDLGNLAHSVVLGKGGERIVTVEASDWRTKAAQQARDAAYAAGKTPVLPRDRRVVDDMAEALSRHTRAIEALAGRTEVSMFTESGGLWLRGQMDAYAPGSHIGDYKTCADASGPGFIRAAWTLRYYMQAAWYQRLESMISGQPELPFLLVAQEKTAPYLVSVWEPTEQYMEMGLMDMQDAIAIYRECTDRDIWPGYDDEIQALTPPDWAIEDDEIEL